MRRNDDFWGRVRKGDGCWEWTGHVNHKGYGATYLGEGMARRTPIPAPRAAWILTHGSIPEGMWVLHHCDNRLCVRPDHLFLGNAQANMDDMRAKGRARWGLYLKARTHCVHGHEYTPENTMWRRGGTSRRCRKCHNARYGAARSVA